MSSSRARGGGARYALLAAKLGARVVAVEPQPFCAAVAAEVFRRNGLGTSALVDVVVAGVPDDRLRAAV